ncbi:Methyltransferase type 11 [Macleaya cordata]|uniref:Methyltransferase type 11 n=1 Tax=Macleaya cordata TaxID=56857 RepID=A0A200Q9C1_MACCD|nr:Methyltransferase type 11 [Macleaya cordata]
MELGLFKLHVIYHNFSSKTLLIRIFFLATVMALIPCLVFYPIDGCEHSWTIQTVNLRMNVSDLNAAFRDLMARNWLTHGYRALSVGRDSVRAVMVMRKLGFTDAIGVDRKPCSSLVRRGNIYGLPFKENSFDFVFSTAMIDGVRVPARMVLEMERVLRPGRIGVLLRRLSGRFPASAMTKAAAPVLSYLKLSDIVDVRTINCTVMVVFRKRFVANGEDEDDDHNNDDNLGLMMMPKVRMKPLPSAGLNSQ